MVVPPKLRLTQPDEPAPPEFVSTGPMTVDEAFQRFAPYIARACLRITGRADEVPDLVQQTFLEAQRDLAQLQHAAAIQAWLLTIATRLALRFLRRRRLIRWVGLDDAPGYEDVAGPTASPADRLMLAKIYRLLDDCPANQRVAWSLRYIEGEPLDRVALLCGCSLATAKRRIADVQRLIEEECGDE